MLLSISSRQNPQNEAKHTKLPPEPAFYLSVGSSVQPSIQSSIFIPSQPITPEQFSFFFSKWFQRYPWMDRRTDIPFVCWFGRFARLLLLVFTAVKMCFSTFCFEIGAEASAATKTLLKQSQCLPTRHNIKIVDNSQRTYEPQRSSSRPMLDGVPDLGVFGFLTIITKNYAHTLSEFYILSLSHQLCYNVTVHMYTYHSYSLEKTLSFS